MSNPRLHFADRKVGRRSLHTVCGLRVPANQATFDRYGFARIGAEHACQFCALALERSKSK